MSFNEFYSSIFWVWLFLKRGGRGGMKRPAPVDMDGKNYPGQKDVNHIKALNMLRHKPLTTKYSKLENTDMAAESETFFNSQKLGFFEQFRFFQDFIYLLIKILIFKKIKKNYSSQTIQPGAAKCGHSENGTRSKNYRPYHPVGQERI